LDWAAASRGAAPIATASNPTRPIRRMDHPPFRTAALHSVGNSGKLVQVAVRDMRQERWLDESCDDRRRTARLTHPTCSFTPCERMSRASKVRPRAAVDPLGFFLKETQGKPRQAATGGQALSPTRQCRLTSELEARRPSRCLNVHKRLHRRASELTTPVPPRPFPALAGRASSAHRHRPLR
jgi:hypothetical protein